VLFYNNFLQQIFFITLTQLHFLITLRKIVLYQNYVTHSLVFYKTWPLIIRNLNQYEYPTYRVWHVWLNQSLEIIMPISLVYNSTTYHSVINSLLPHSTPGPPADKDPENIYTVFTKRSNMLGYDPRLFHITIWYALISHLYLWSDI
jgi:hypothetical protein